MNYKQKYEEAIERCKSWIRGEHPECFTEAQKAGEFIFPELRESEDERIRKCLIKGLSAMRDIHKHQTFSDDAINIDDAIAWLEKQGEQKTEIEYIYPKFRIGDVIEPIQPNGNSRPVRVLSISKKTKSYCCESDDHNVYSSIPIRCENEYKLVEQKPAEWSDEDEENLNNVVKELDITKRSRDKILYAQYDKLIDWLKSLKPNHWKPS